jgi:hypothetical protein
MPSPEQLLQELLGIVDLVAHHLLQQPSLSGEGGHEGLLVAGHGRDDGIRQLEGRARMQPAACIRVSTARVSHRAASTGAAGLTGHAP